jgi:hypothetical protein
LFPAVTLDGRPSRNVSSMSETDGHGEIQGHWDSVWTVKADRELSWTQQGPPI